MIVERSAPHRSRFAFSALQPIPAAAVQRAAALVVPRRDGLIMSDACHVWCLMEARDRDRREHKQWVQRELERLRASAPDEDRIARAAASLRLRRRRRQRLRIGAR
jgi:hypothetical protein